MDSFRASVQIWAEVVECAALTGEMDYLLRVQVADMTQYSRFIMDTHAQACQRAGLQNQLCVGPGEVHHTVSL